MKKFLSVLLAVMMVLSCISYAVPSVVGNYDAVAEPEVVDTFVAAPEDTAVLAADDTWYDIEKGTLLFNMDFETDNSGSAVSASAYDAISLGSYSAGAGELVSGPDIVSRGFVYVRESETLMDDCREVVQEALDSCLMRGISDWGKIKTSIKDSLGEFLWKRTKRSPMILPIITEV